MPVQDAPMRLGDKLKAIRLHLGFTLEEMAAAVGKTGLSRRARVHEWETGKREPDYGSLLAYARLVGASTDVLLDDSLDLILRPYGKPAEKRD
jgi:transcriptional regulator with XRE-family HTH domain